VRPDGRDQERGFGGHGRREAEAIRTEGWRWLGIGQEAMRRPGACGGSGRTRWRCLPRMTRDAASWRAVAMIAEQCNNSDGDLPEGMDFKHSPFSTKRPLPSAMRTKSPTLEPSGCGSWTGRPRKVGVRNSWQQLHWPVSQPACGR